jgi:hypothetical protein
VAERLRFDIGSFCSVAVGSADSSGGRRRAVMIVVAWFRFLLAFVPSDARPESRRRDGAGDGIGGRDR